MSTYKKAKLLKIKSAISEFLINTQKIVKSVEPSAEIIVLQTPSKRARAGNQVKLEKQSKIIIPDFKNNESDECTDDEFYQEAHKSREKLEILLRTCPELSKIKSGMISTLGIHQKGKTVENLNRNLKELKKRIGKNAEGYEGIAVKKRKWPGCDAEDDLVVKLP